jgi:hypothetical protein
MDVREYIIDCYWELLMALYRKVEDLLTHDV